MIAILTGLTALVTSAISSISTTLPTLGLALKTFIAKIPGPFLEKYLQNIIRFIGNLAKVFFNLNCPCDELGYKARVADKKEEEFKTTEDYLKYLDNNVQFDKAAFESSSTLERLECGLRGMGLAHKAIEEKAHIVVSPLFLAMSAALAIKPEVTMQCLSTLKDTNVSTDDIFAYFKGTCSPEKVKAVDDVVKKFFTTPENPYAIQDMQAKVREMGL